MTSSGTSATSTRTQKTPRLSLPGIMNSEIAKIFNFKTSFVEMFYFWNLIQLAVADLVLVDLRPDTFTNDILNLNNFLDLFDHDLTQEGSDSSHSPRLSAACDSSRPNQHPETETTFSQRVPALPGLSQSRLKRDEVKTEKKPHQHRVFSF